MLTLKKLLRKNDVESSEIASIVRDYSHEERVKVALYMAEDVSHFINLKDAKKCIEFIRKWLEGRNVKTTKILSIVNRTYHANNRSNYKHRFANYAAADAVNSILCKNIRPRDFEDFYTNFTNISHYASGSYLEKEEQERKKQEYLSYARFFAYEDLDFPYKKESKAFNLDNSVDLNVFLDFLTDNYPAALTYPREEYFENKLAKEYLKVIYQS